MNLKKIHSVYFIGIGGIGMSALARWFNANGYFVAGYDKTPTPLTQELELEGIAVHFEDSVDAIPEKIKHNASESLIVYTPAIPKDHKEYNFLLESGFQIMKRSQVLGELTKSHFTIAVAGTHGKTTTSSIIAHILKSSGKNCTAFVGGIMTNYNSNLIIGTDAPDCVMVVEADEYDRSFLTLHPDIAVITAVDADHLDIYGSADSLKDTFKDFINNIKKDGKLFIEERAAAKVNIQDFKNVSVQTYGLKGGNVQANNVTVHNGIFHFEYSKNDFSIKDLKLSLPGFHNVENSLAAISACLAVEIEGKAIQTGIEKYQGVKRRFEYIIKSDDLIFIDDYAHHPEEITALLKSVKALYPKKITTAIFQPHLYTRTRDFADEFGKSLGLADRVILLDIYPARELPISGVTSEMLLEKTEGNEKFICSKEELIENLQNSKLEVLLTVGAGDIDALVQPIKTALTS